MEIHLEKASIHNDNNLPGPVDGFSCHISNRSWSTKYTKALKSPPLFNGCCDFPKSSLESNTHLVFADYNLVAEKVFHISSPTPIVGILMLLKTEAYPFPMWCKQTTLVHGTIPSGMTYAYIYA